jgi:RNA polymerase sigma-70 factor (ECF subfamily)
MAMCGYSLAGQKDRENGMVMEPASSCFDSGDVALTPWKSSYAEVSLNSTEALNQFLGRMERHSFIMSQIATRNREDSLDIVQDAMLGFVRHYASRPEDEWKPLYYRVLNSRIRDWQRRNIVRSRFRAWLGFFGDETEEAEDPLERIADSSSPDPAQRLILDDSAEAVRVALRTLPLRQRQAFLLRAWEGMDVKETALAMGCSEGSVKTHYSRAVHALRGLLEEYRP